MKLELLLRRWSKAKTGEGQVVLLCGEAGIGKSRLTAALLERLATEPHTRFWCVCSTLTQPRPPVLWGLQSALGPLLSRSVDAPLALCKTGSRVMRLRNRVCHFTSGGGDHAPFSAFVVFRPRVIRPCLFRIKCVGAEVRRSAVCSSLCIDLVVGKANSALRVRSRGLQVRVMLGS